MKPSTLQSMITINGNRIADIHFDIACCLSQAGYDKTNGELAFAQEEYQVANRQRTKLRKAVSLQIEMKTELAALHREARIVRKLMQLVKLGAGIPAASLTGLTDHEIEAGCDRVLEALVAKKPDSRLSA